MSCSSYDWKAYALGEVDPGDRHHAEAHAATCPNCREELATLRLTLDALSTLKEEEIPRRIAFVSDKVFEPRLWRRWTQVFLRPSFAAAAIIAAAILVHAFVRPAPSIDTAALESRIDAAVMKAVAETQQIQEQKRAQETAKLLAATEQRFAEQRQADLATAGYNIDLLRKQLNNMYALNTGAGIR